METKVPGSMDVPDFTSVPVPFMSTTQARADLWRRRLSCQNIVTRQAVRTRQVNPMLQASVQAFHVELTGHPAVCLVLSFSLSASTICMLSPPPQSEKFRLGRMFDLFSRRTRQNLALPRPTPRAQFSYGLVRQIHRSSCGEGW